jgi:hypothetical protein
MVQKRAEPDHCRLITRDFRTPSCNGSEKLNDPQRSAELSRGTSLPSLVRLPDICPVLESLRSLGNAFGELGQAVEWGLF